MVELRVESRFVCGQFTMVCVLPGTDKHITLFIAESLHKCLIFIKIVFYVQGGSNMTGTICV